MTHRKWLSSSALVAVAFIAACGSDSTTQPGANLTTAQAQAMASALGSLLGTSFGQVQGSRTAAPHFDARFVAEIQSGYTVSRSCPEQGHFGAFGSGTFDSLDAFHVMATDTLIDCGIKDSHGDIWEFTTEPVVTSALDFASPDDLHFSLSQTTTGSIHYSMGALGGTCTIDVSVASQTALETPSLDSATTSIETDGSVCGRAVSRDTTIVSFFPHI